MNETLTLVIVSDEDFKAHQNANELINIEDYPVWRKSHHECVLKLNENDEANEQMQRMLKFKAVMGHVKENRALYRFDYDDPIDIYPFKPVTGEDVLRPSDTIWNHPTTSGYQFVYITSHRPNLPHKSLMFVKFWDREKRTLTFCGSLLVSHDKPVADRFNHIRKMCGVTDESLKMILLDVFSKTYFRRVDLTLNFRKQGLRTGAVLVLQTSESTIATRPQTGLANPPYNTHQYENLDVNPDSLGMKLYQQACSGHYTDVVISLTASPVNLFAHKNVLATVPYFKTCFESGMQESTKLSVVELKAPDWIAETSLRDFLSVVYIKDYRALNQLSIKRLCNLLKMADYYAADELLDNVAMKIEESYAALSGETSLLLLETIGLLEFPQKENLKSLAVDYIICNFSEVARLREFRDLFGKDVYNEIVDAMARATWLKE